MKIAISLDSACDLSKELIEEYGFYVVPFGVSFGDRSFLDGEVDATEIFEYAEKNKTLPKTNAVNSEQFKEHFDNILKSNDAIIHFSLSEEMSSAYNNALSVSKEYENVYCIDSRSLSTGIALEAIYAYNLIKDGYGVKEVVEKVEKIIPKVQASFIIERLDYLYKGGRCSSLALLGANILKIRPEIDVINGKMVSGSKYRGNMEDCVEKYCRSVLEKNNNYDNSIVFITHSKATENMVERAERVVKEYGFKRVYETTAGCTISSHCGKNTLGILFINK